MTISKFKFNILFHIVLLLAINCSQLDGGSTITGQEAFTQILGSATVGSVIGGTQGSVPVGTELTCENGEVRTVTKPYSNSNGIFPALFFPTLLNLSETRYYSKLDVQNCANIAFTIFSEFEKQNARVIQKNETCNERNPSPPNPAFVSLIPCEIEKKARLTLTFGSSSSSSDEE